MLRFLIETRNPSGRTLVASVESNADDAMATLLEHLHAVGLPIVPTDDHGNPDDAVYAHGPAGSKPEVWEADNGTRVVFQVVLAD